MRALSFAVAALLALPVPLPARGQGTHRSEPAPPPAPSRSDGPPSAWAPSPAPSAAGAPSPGRSGLTSRPRSGAARRVGPALPYGAPRPYGRPVPYAYPGYLYDGWGFGFAPAWWGLGFGPGWALGLGWGPGWGYGPGWGWGSAWAYGPVAPPPDGDAGPEYEYGYERSLVQRDERAPTVSTRLLLTGAGTLHRGGYSGGLALGIEGERLGFEAGLDGFYPGRGYYGASSDGFDSSTTYALFSGHLTYAVLSSGRGRLRLEAGASVVSWPDLGPDAGSVAFGPDLGLSGELALLGPLGVEGYARATPYPVPVYDWRAALALRFGPASITAGWRELSVQRASSGSRNQTRFAHAGPQVGFGLRF